VTKVADNGAKLDCVSLFYVSLLLITFGALTLLNGKGFPVHLRSRNNHDAPLYYAAARSRASVDLGGDRGRVVIE